jgi:hypothetical protein
LHVIQRHLRPAARLRRAGSGVFDYNNASMTSQLNFVNPALRDTLSVLANGWAAIRFRVSCRRRHVCLCWPADWAATRWNRSGSTASASRQWTEPFAHAAAANDGFRNCNPCHHFALCSQADNPGVWPFHCHISAHAFIGQMLYFVNDPDSVIPPPDNLPTCHRNCTYNFAPWTPGYVKERFGSSGYELP